MAINSVLHIYTKDKQGPNGYTERMTVGCTAATFGATTLPTIAHIEAFIATIFAAAADALLSTSVVYAYSVEVINELGLSPQGGDGVVATAIALKTRNDIGGASVDGWELRIPGFNKNAVLYDPTNSNAVVTASDPFPPIRTAALDIGYRDPTDPGSTPLSSDQIMQSGVVFNGKRAAKRPR